MDWRVFDKLQEDDLVAALARRQADEEGRLRILGAQQDMQAAQERAAVSRDNAETNRVYREGLIEQRQRDNENDRIRNEAEAAERGLKTETLKNQRAALERLANDPNADPQDRRAATMDLAGMKYSPLRIDSGNRRARLIDRERNELIDLGPIGDQDSVHMEAPEPRPNITLPGSGLSPSQYRLAVSDLSRQYVRDTAQERTSMDVYRRAKTAWDTYKVRAQARDPGAQSVLVQFQKTLDPDSVVRESEYLRSVEGQPFVNRLYAIWTQFNLGGPRIDDAGMQAYLNVMGEWAAQAKKSHDLKVQRIARVAQRFEIPLNEVVADLPGDTPNPAPTQPAQTAPATTAAPGQKRDPLGLRGGG